MKYSTLITIGLLLPAAMVGAQEQTATPVPQSTTQEQLEELQGVVTDPKGEIQTTVSDVKKLNKIKFSGYAQIRYENTQNNAGLVSVNKNSFNVRRIRLKASATPAAHTTAVLEGDFGNTSPSLKSGYIEWYPMALKANQSWMLTAGQVTWPFGFQLAQSSAVRETPEYPQVYQRLFPGEYDRGVQITSPSSKPVWFQLGLFNGIGANKPDDNSNKDWVGRVRWEARPNLALGASFYLGRALSVASASAGKPTTGFVDSNGNGVKDPGEASIIIPGATAVSAVESTKNRFGADLEWRPVEKLALKGEYILGKEFVSSVKETVNVHGWYAQAAYDILPKTQGVVMFDDYRDTTTNSKDILHVGLIQHLNESTKAKLFYQFVNEIVGLQVANNVLTVEMVTKF